MRARSGWLLLVVLSASFLGARAEEVVYFTNGTYMRVQSHELQGTMVRVRLEGDASMAFPSKMIEKIEGSLGVVFSAKSATVQANQALPGPARGTGAEASYPVGINPALASRGDTALDSKREPFKPGGAISGPEANNSFNDGSIMGSIREGVSGSRIIGNKLVIDSGKPPGGRDSFHPVPFAAKPEALRPQPEITPVQPGAPTNEPVPTPEPEAGGDS